MVERSVEPCRKALADAGKSASDIDEVLMVGGSTRIPRIQQAVEDGATVRIFYESRLAKVNITEDGRKLQIFAHHTGKEWRFFHREKRFEAVYHLYSTELKHGPLILRLRTENRAAPAPLGLSRRVESGFTSAPTDTKGAAPGSGFA